MTTQPRGEGDWCHTRRSRGVKASDSESVLERAKTLQSSDALPMEPGKEGEDQELPAMLGKQAQSPG